MLLTLLLALFDAGGSLGADAVQPRQHVSTYLAGAHLGFNKNSNALRRLLEKKKIEPECCRALEFLAYGPVLPYWHKQDHPDYERCRKVIGALERKLWIAAQDAGNVMLNERPRFADEFDASLWGSVHAAFARCGILG